MSLTQPDIVSSLDIDFLFKWLDDGPGFSPSLDHSVNQAVGEHEEHEAS